MAEGERFTYEDVAVGEVGVVVEVAAAETGGGDADLEFIWGWGRKVPGFLIVINIMVFGCSPRLNLLFEGP